MKFPRFISANFVIRLIAFTSLLLTYVVVSKIFNHDIGYFNELFSIVLFYSVYFLTPSIWVDKSSIISPKNLMLLVFIMRLVVCPLSILLFGPQSWKLPFAPESEDLFLVHTITFIAFLSFILGWDLIGGGITNETVAKRPVFKFRNNFILFLLLFGCLIFIIYGYYGSLNGYLNSMFLEDYQSIQESNSKIVVYLTILFRYGIPFIGIMLGLFTLNSIRGGVWTKALIAFISILIILFLALGPSRNNMIFPVLAFLAACIPIYFRINFRDFTLGAFGFLVLLFMFQNIRKRENALIINDLNRTEKFVEFIQVYFVSPHIMSPMVRIEEEFDPVPFTLHSSILETVPILGTSFRDKSGSYIYNVAYGRAVGPDQVFPTYGEIYLNLGLAGLIVVFFVTGFIYRKIDEFFRTKTIIDPLLRALVFYLALLFNATIFYSYSVLGQFTFYNSILIFIILIFRDKVSVNEAVY